MTTPQPQYKPINLPLTIVGSISNDLSSKEKRTKKVICTHNGRFHCDDALAVGLLCTLPEYLDALVVRSREEKDHKDADVVVDVGGIDDASNLRFDHHQKGFSTTFDASHTTTKMSSAGMVYRHFGHRILKEVFQVDENYIPSVHLKVYEKLVESIDAIDNGVDVCSDPRYLVRTDLSSRVSRLNEDWLTYSGDQVTADAFRKAIKISMKEFCDHVHYYKSVWLPARQIVEDGVKTRELFHRSGRLIKLERGCPHEEHLAEIEAELGIGPPPSSSPLLGKGILFTIYPNSDDKTSWRVKAVAVNNKSFENRLSLPERTRGIRQDGLAAMGLEGVNFVHHAGFLAGCSSEEAGLRLAELTLKEAGVI